MDPNPKKSQQIFNKQCNTKAGPFTERKSTELLSNNKAWPVARNSRRRDQASVPAAGRNEQTRYNNNNNNYNNNISSKQQHQYPTASGKGRPNADKRPRTRPSANGGGEDGDGDAAIAMVAVAGGHASDARVEEPARQLADLAAAGAGLALAPVEASAPPTAPIGRGALPKRRTPTTATASASAGNGQHDFEMNSIYAPGSKKQNLNHLLNFHYATRDTDFTVDRSLNMFGRRNGPQPARKQRGLGLLRKPKFNKEQFMQANFQFVVKSTGKPLNMTSPDTLIDWHLIEQINIQTTEEPMCPICLYPPIAAKLTRCGHAYCWPCLLHYLAQGDKTWCDCPVCNEPVHVKDLKSTVIVQQWPCNVGSDITFQLMRRKKDSLFVERHDPNADVQHTQGYPFMSSGDDIKAFSKLLLAKRSDVLAIIERERAELEGGEKEADCLQDPYIQQAIALLDERLRKMGDEKPSGSAEKLSLSEEANEQKSTEGSQKFFYFYQSQDGQNVFLHSLNVKMLQACYGSLEHAPLTIRSRILQKEHFSMDEEQRRKFVGLSHLPVTCQFAMVEVDLQPPVITDNILREFHDEVLQRKKERQRREREERKREKHIDELNDRQMGKLIASTVELNVSSAQEFPTCGFEDYLSGGAQAGGSGGTGGSGQASRQGRSSYSTVAVDGRGCIPKTTYWPTIQSSSGGHTTTTYNSYQALSTWGKTPQERRHIVGGHTVAAGDNAEHADGIPMPTPMHTNLSDVVAEAMLQKKQSGGKPNNGAAPAGGKKRKAKKMQPLFCTGINFNGNNN